MELTDEQKQAVAKWASDGDGLSEIQRKLTSEFGISMTYMDVRFLIIDLGADVQDAPEPVTKQADVSADELPDGGPSPREPAAAEGSQLVGGVSVELDRLMKPGTLVSGSVTFSDGTTAKWGLDQMGRLALDAGQSGYTPSEEDLRSFQDELRSALEKRGF